MIETRTSREMEVLLGQLEAQRRQVPPRRPDPDWASRSMEPPDLRSVVMHTVTETAVHAGHLDAVRELIDGRQWVVL